MAWFDGTFDYAETELNDKFPIVPAEDLRLSADGKKIAIINCFDEDTPLYDFADPMVGDENNDRFVFYHVFTGKNADAAKDATESFLAASDENDSERISLFRRDPDRLYLYSYGHISLTRLYDQEALKKLFAEDLPDSGEVFILPLKRFLHRCPVCGHRTLPYRNYYLVCDECGWEDEGIDDEDEGSGGANGDCTIRQYREKYLKSKQANPRVQGDGKTG